MQAKDAEAEIVRNPNPLILPSTMTVLQAARNMESHRVSAVLVTEGDAGIVGIFTGRDAIARVLARGRDPVVTPLSEVMTFNLVEMTAGHSAIEALRLMQAADCRHLPIVDEGKIIGLVSRGDFRGADQERLDD